MPRIYRRMTLRTIRGIGEAGSLREADRRVLNLLKPRCPVCGSLVDVEGYCYNVNCDYKTGDAARNAKAGS